MSPARTTILRDVLVSNVSKIALSFNVVPDPGLWKVYFRKLRLRVP
jgi:hypothetical protein